MARGKKSAFTRRRIGVIAVGAVLLIFLTNVVLSGGEDLFLGNPFTDDFNFVDVQSDYPMLFDISGVNIRVTDFIVEDPNGGINYFCTIKLKTQVTFDDGGKIFLDSAPQRFSPLFTELDVTTRAGRVINFFDTIPLMTCDVINAKDDPTTSVDESKLGVLGQGRLPFEVTTQNFHISLDAYNEQGRRTSITGGQAIKFTGSGDQGEPIVFRDDPSIEDPLKVFEGCVVNCGLFIGNERQIGKNFRVTADQIENVLKPSKDFESRVIIELGGQINLEIPYLSDKLNDRFIVKIPIRGQTVQNQMDLEIDIDAPVTIGGEGLTTKITNISPSQLVTDGTPTSELLRVFISVNNWTEAEGRPTCEAISSRFVQPIFTVKSTVAGEESLVRGSDGVNSFFECRLRMPNTAPIGTYEIKAGTENTNRADVTSTMEVLREGDGQCPKGQIRNITGECVTEFGGACPDDQFRTSEGDCVPEGTIACFDCLDRQIRTVGLNEECPVFPECPDKQPLIPCTDGKPATKIASGFTCNRDIGKALGFLPTLVDCEGEGRTADAEKGEICVPSWVIWLVENIVTVLIASIILIIFFAIIGAIVKRSPVGIISRGFRP